MCSAVCFPGAPGGAPSIPFCVVCFLCGCVRLCPRLPPGYHVNNSLSVARLMRARILIYKNFQWPSPHLASQPMLSLCSSNEAQKAEQPCLLSLSLCLCRRLTPTQQCPRQHKVRNHRTRPPLLGARHLRVFASAPAPARVPSANSLVPAIPAH